MKKLLLAPFLLASMFSFGGELKANQDSSSQVDIQPMARSSDHWQMLRFLFRYRKYPLWGEDNCSPKKNDKCIKNHSHIGSTGKFAISSFRGLGQGPMIFDSSSACINEANSLKSFYSSIPQTNSIYHSHDVKGEGDQYSHRHHSDKLVKHDFKYYCFQSSSIDFDATELKDVWYMKAITLEKTRYPIGWGETDCKPKKKNGNCRNNHSHNTSRFYTDSESSNLYRGLYFTRFDSYNKCELTGSQINSFLSNNLSLTGSLQHTHSSGGNDNLTHNHPIDNRYKLGMRYRCIKAKGY